MKFNELLWNYNLKKVQIYINENKCKPPRNHKDKNIKKLGIWFINQEKNYKNNIATNFLCFSLQNNNNAIMNDNIKIKWEEFINKNKEYFLSNEEIWNNNLNKVKLYIQKNNCKPYKQSEDNYTKKLSVWIYTQKNNYKKYLNIMKNNNIRIKWEQFLEEYKEYFLSYNQEWNNTLEKIKLYIKKYHRKPSTHNKDNDIKHLAYWIDTQKRNYKTMKNENIKNKWQQFLVEYKKYFLNHDELWDNNLKQVKLYIDVNKCKPKLQKNKDNNINQLVNWLYTQKKNYKKNIKNMKDIVFRRKWEEFIKKYY